MKKRILNIIKWAALAGYLIVALGFASRMRDKTKCNSIKIIINSESHFIDSADVAQLLASKNLNLDSIPLSKINFDQVENTIKTHSAVEKVEAFSSYDGKMVISIDQRLPVLRVIPEDLSKTNGFYIDSKGKIMPLSDKYSAHVPLLTGKVSPELIASIVNDSVKNAQVLKTYHYTLYEIYQFANYIYSHELWGPQFEQIYINDQYDIELIPRVGNHVIVMGNLVDYKYKLYKLEAMYREGFKMADWNSYSVINLKYSNQVVCTK